MAVEGLTSFEILRRPGSGREASAPQWRLRAPRSGDSRRFSAVLLLLSSRFDPIHPRGRCPAIALRTRSGRFLLIGHVPLPRRIGCAACQTREIPRGIAVRTTKSTRLNDGNSGCHAEAWASSGRDPSGSTAQINRIGGDASVGGLPLQGMRLRKSRHHE